MIVSSLHNADYITSTHPNTGFLDANNEHEVSIEQNDTPMVTEAVSPQAIEWIRTGYFMQIITVMYMQTRK